MAGGYLKLKAEAPGLFNNWEHNCNQLVPMGTQSKSGFGGGAYKTSLCRIVKIKELRKE